MLLVNISPLTIRTNYETIKKIRYRVDSNHRPILYQRIALPTELLYHKKGRLKPFKQLPSANGN